MTASALTPLQKPAPAGVTSGPARWSSHALLTSLLRACCGAAQLPLWCRTTAAVHHRRASGAASEAMISKPVSYLPGVCREEALMERVDSMSDDPSLGGSEDSGELSPRPTARLEDFLFDATGVAQLVGLECRDRPGGFRDVLSSPFLHACAVPGGLQVRPRRWATASIVL